MDPNLTKEEKEFLEIMHSFPLGHSEDTVIVGKWFEDKDLLQTVKQLYALKMSILEKVRTTRGTPAIEAKASEYCQEYYDEVDEISREEREMLMLGFKKGAVWMHNTIYGKP